jgi:hypothetical protein
MEIISIGDARMAHERDMLGASIDVYVNGNLVDFGVEKMGVRRAPPQISRELTVSDTCMLAPFVRLNQRRYRGSRLRPRTASLPEQRPARRGTFARGIGVYYGPHSP